MAEGTGDKRLTTRRSRDVLWAFAAGALTVVLGVNVEWGDLGGVFDRVRNGVEAVQTPPSTTAVQP